MKRFAGRALLLSAILFLVNACASSSNVASDSPMQSAGTVPGEKVEGGEMGAGAGPSGASANVRW
jgi:hypothetical protein